MGQFLPKFLIVCILKEQDIDLKRKDIRLVKYFRKTFLIMELDKNRTMFFVLQLALT